MSDLSTNSFWIFLESISLKKQALLLEEVHKLNRENTEKSGQHLDQEVGVPCKDQEPDTCSLVDYLHEVSLVAVAENLEIVEVVGQQKDLDEVQDAEQVAEEVKGVTEDDTIPAPDEKNENVVCPDEEVSKTLVLPTATEEKETTAKR